jgi:hypothetical protein
MKLSVKSIAPSHGQNVLASATVELSDSDGNHIIIADIRILENKLGQRWVALPSFSVSRGGKDFQYLPTVELSPSLMRELSDRVLSTLEQQAAEQP